MSTLEEEVPTPTTVMSTESSPLLVTTVTSTGELETKACQRSLFFSTDPSDVHSSLLSTLSFFF